jgi:putative ABC transport system permease protein
VRWEALLLALFGTVGGLIVGSFFGWAIVEALKEQGFEVFDYPVGQLLVIGAVGTGAGVLAALLPARRAARLDVLRAVQSL